MGGHHAKQALRSMQALIWRGADGASSYDPLASQLRAIISSSPTVAHAQGFGPAQQAGELVRACRARSKSGGKSVGSD